MKLLIVDSWIDLCRVLGKENSLGYMLTGGDSVGHKEEGRGFARKDSCAKLNCNNCYLAYIH